MKRMGSVPTLENMLALHILQTKRQLAAQHRQLLQIELKNVAQNTNQDSGVYKGGLGVQETNTNSKMKNFM